MIEGKEQFGNPWNSKSRKYFPLKAVPIATGNLKR